MAETRRATRVSSKKQCMIRTAGRPDMMCVIQNLSNTGAMLNFPNPTILPRVFSMKFDGVELRATVMWQSGRLAGVRFQTPLKGIGAQEKRKWLWSRR